MVLSWRVPDAALPPPFPSFRPQRLYISNMGVSPSARRRGVARAPLATAEATAAAWGQPEIWLHVDAANTGARLLYEACGFTMAPDGQDPFFVPPAQRRLLLRKAVPRRWRLAPGGAAAAAARR
jgi:ribosomal protein S18 acetylase RimI-like enzyme